jgi:hypothetical protein
MRIMRSGSGRGGRVPLLLVLAAALAASSCGGGGPRIYSVHGQVFYEGKPADGAIVFFHPQGDHRSAADLPSGKVGSDGSFELLTYNRGKGAAAGRYSVTISWTDPAARTEDDEKQLLPARYLDPTTSQLAAEVKEEDNKLPPFQLRR